jgi:hypothetical protein
VTFRYLSILMAPKRLADEHVGTALPVAKRIRESQAQREITRCSTNLQPQSSLGRLSPEIRLQIWEHLLVSTNAVTPRYRVCYESIHMIAFGIRQQMSIQLLSPFDFCPYSTFVPIQLLSPFDFCD